MIQEQAKRIRTGQQDEGSKGGFRIGQALDQANKLILGFKSECGVSLAFWLITTPSNLNIEQFAAKGISNYLINTSI
jgi:hypothetical protein